MTTGGGWLGNSRAGWTLFTRRWHAMAARRHLHRIGGWRWLAAALFGSLFLTVTIDPLYIAGRDAWPHWLVALGPVNVIGKSSWSLWPLGVALLLSPLLPWGRMKGAALARATHRVQLAWYFFASIGLAELLSSLAKQAIGRARPGLFAEHGLHAFDPWSFTAGFASFPSGHSTCAAALFAALALYTGRFRVAFAAMAVITAFGRALVGAHYPADIFAGLMFGAWISYAVAIVMARLRMVFSVTPDGRLVRNSGFSALAGHRRATAASRLRPPVRV